MGRTKQINIDMRTKKNTKNITKAQRKYAQRANVPFHIHHAYPEPELEPLVPVQLSPIIIQNLNKPVGSLLDAMSFPDHVPQCKDDPNLRLSAIVVLERLSPTLTTVPEPAPARPEPAPARPDPAPARPEPAPARPEASRPMNEASNAEPLDVPAKKCLRKKLNKVINKTLCLRSRTINIYGETGAKKVTSAAKKAKLTKCIKAVQNPKSFKCTRKSQKIPLSRMDTISEDNQPLTYFAKLKLTANTDVIPDEPITSEAEIPAGEIPAAEFPAAEFPAVKTPAAEFSVADIFPEEIPLENIIDPGIPLENEDDECSHYDEYEPFIFESSDYELSDSGQNVAAPRVLQELKCITITEPSRPSNPFMDLVIDIFNWKDDNDDRDFCIVDTQGKVQDWLITGTQTSEFKVPTDAAPRRSHIVSETPSVSSVGAAPLTETEKHLRETCPAWKYQRCGIVVVHAYMINKFCGRCTRCRIIFDSEAIAEREERSDRATTSQIPSPELLQKIARSTNYKKSLLEIMTDQGRKILKAAVVLRQKLDSNIQFSQKEQLLLGSVLGVLTECNTARIAPVQQHIPPIPSSVFLDGNSTEPGCSNGSEPGCSNRQSTSSELGPPLLVVKDVDEPSALTKAPKILATESDFNLSPIVFANNILVENPQISMIGVKPPDSFKPTCNLDAEELGIKTTNQYVHRMMTRWSDATRELAAIRSTQDPKIQRSPLFEGLEVDLVALYHAVQDMGGIEMCQNNTEMWKHIARCMNLSSRTKAYTKLQYIYLKYLLDYNTRTDGEKSKAISEVEKCWREREARALSRAQNPLWRQMRMEAGSTPVEDDAASHLETVVAEAEECITPGRTMNVASFKKLAQQVLANHFADNDNPTPEEVEIMYYFLQSSTKRHVCVLSASVDAAEHNVGFSSRVNPMDQRWNLKNLRTLTSNLLSYLGEQIGVSRTSIHYGMALTTSCWHMDPTSVPWIEYLHKGPPKIWYTISADQEELFRDAVKELCPYAVQNKGIWLPCEILMIPPRLLKSRGVNVQRHIQYEGEYVIVFPKTYCACICTGYTISEGVYYAPHSTLCNIRGIYDNLRRNCEPSLFSMEELIISMAASSATPYLLLNHLEETLSTIIHGERSCRLMMTDKNINFITPEEFQEQQNRKRQRTLRQIQSNSECAYCRRHLYLSKVVGVVEGELCAEHGLMMVNKSAARGVQLSNVYCIVMFPSAKLISISNVFKANLLAKRND